MHRSTRRRLWQWTGDRATWLCEFLEFASDHCREAAVGVPFAANELVELIGRTTDPVACEVAVRDDVVHGRHADIQRVAGHEVGRRLHEIQFSELGGEVVVGSVLSSTWKRMSKTME